jgi:hypothetical protein
LQAIREALSRRTEAYPPARGADAIAPAGLPIAAADTRVAAVGLASLGTAPGSTMPIDASTAADAGTLADAIAALLDEECDLRGIDR